MCHAHYKNAAKGEAIELWGISCRWSSHHFVTVE